MDQEGADPNAVLHVNTTTGYNQLLHMLPGMPAMSLEGLTI